MDKWLETVLASPNPPDEPGMRFFPEYNYLVQPSVLVLSGLLYLVVSYILFKFVPKIEELTLLMRIYNVAQVAVCGYMTYGLVTYMYQDAEPLDVFGHRLPNIFAFNVRPSPGVEFFILIHYLSKFLDFFDTIFIALRKKERQFSFLHLYHHATIGPIWGMLLYLGYGWGTAGYGALINSFTHVIMYTHYFVTSFGIKNPLKKYITLWQIVQFYSCVAHAALVVVLPIEHEYPKWLAFLQLFYHTTMIVLFSSFFDRTFKGGKGNKGNKDRRLNATANGNGHIETSSLHAEGDINGTHISYDASKVTTQRMTASSREVTVTSRRTLRASTE